MSQATEMNMNQICLSDVEVKDVVKAVIEPLKDGISSLNRVYEDLIDADVDPISGQCSNYSSIRQQIVLAHQNLKQSEQAASAGLRGLDENIEKLTQEEGRLEKEKGDTERILANLKTQQDSNENVLKNSRGALDQAQSTLSSARQTLQDMESRRHNAEIITGVGAGLFAIPVIGWIAGAGMVIGGAVELDQAKNGVRVAEEEVRNSESQVENYERKVSDYGSKISQTEQNIRQKHDRLEQIRMEIHNVKEKREAVADFQNKVRCAVNLLSTLSGRASVAESQTRRIILQEPVTKVMEEVMKATGEIAGNQLLYAEEIPRLMDKMRKNNQKLVAICASDSKAEDENYY